VTIELLELAIVTARYAGDVILSHYRRVDETKLKGDGSPLTLADQAAHKAIISLLGDSGIPVVSEEGDDLFMDARRYWLVDPLDGTKDFIAANDEFTVNIALIDGGRPVLGVVFAPALRELYAGQSGIGSWCEKAGIRFDCQSAGKTAACRMAVSRFHDHPDVDVFAAANGIGNSVAIGSALKYGRLATAEVDVFPRLVGSSEWDTAAGQAVLEGAGGQVLDWHTGQTLCYGKPRRRNPRLLSVRAPYNFTDFQLQYYEPGIP
jgi:3'(2'), 5'-bisphosphate nucleotidase